MATRMGRRPFDQMEALCGSMSRGGVARQNLGILRMCPLLAGSLLLIAVIEAHGRGRLFEEIPERFIAWIMAGNRGGKNTVFEELWKAGASPPLALAPSSVWFNAEQCRLDLELSRDHDLAPAMTQYLGRRALGRSVTTEHAHRSVCARASYPDPLKPERAVLSLMRPQSMRAVYYAFAAWEFFGRGIPGSGRFDVHELAAILEAMCNACTCMQPNVLIGGPRVPPPGAKEKWVKSHDGAKWELGDHHRHDERTEFCVWTGTEPPPGRSLSALAEFAGLGKDARRLWALHPLVRFSIFHGQCMLGQHPRFGETLPETNCNRFPVLVENAVLSSRELGATWRGAPALLRLEPASFDSLLAEGGELRSRPGTRALVRRFRCSTDCFLEAPDFATRRQAGVVFRVPLASANTLAMFFARLLSPETRNVDPSEIWDKDPRTRIVRTAAHGYVLCRRWEVAAARALSAYRLLAPKRWLGVSDPAFLALNADHIMLEYMRGDIHELHYAMKLLWHSLCPKSRLVGKGNLRRLEGSLEPLGAELCCPRFFYRRLHSLLARAVRGSGVSLREHVASVWTRHNARHPFDLAGPTEFFGQHVPGLEFERPHPEGVHKQVRNDRMRAFAIAEDARVPFILRGVQSFLEMHLPHYIDWDLARELAVDPLVWERHTVLHRVLVETLAKGGQVLDRRGMSLPQTIDAGGKRTYAHWLLYELCLDRKAVTDRTAYRIFCRTLTRSGFALRPSPDDPPQHSKHPNVDFEDEPNRGLHAKPFYHLNEDDRDLRLWEKKEDEEMKDEKRIKRTIRPLKRAKHGAANRLERHSADEADELFERYASPAPAAEARPLAVGCEDGADDLAALWELVQIVCSEERVLLTPSRERLLAAATVPLGFDYKYVIEPDRSKRMGVLYAMYERDYVGLPPALPASTIAADCEGADVVARMAAGGPVSLFGVRDPSVVESCVFDGALQQQPSVFSGGFNGYRQGSLSALFSRDTLLRIFRFLPVPEKARRVCKQWKLLIDLLVSRRV